MELIGIVPVKLFNRKCSRIIFGEKIFDLNNLLELILVGGGLGLGAKLPPMGRPTGGRGAPPLPRRARGGGGEGEKERDSVFPQTSVSFPMWKIKGMN